MDLPNYPCLKAFSFALRLDGNLTFLIGSHSNFQLAEGRNTLGDEDLTFFSLNPAQMRKSGFGSVLNSR